MTIPITFGKQNTFLESNQLGNQFIYIGIESALKNFNKGKPVYRLFLTNKVSMQMMKEICHITTLQDLQMPSNDLTELPPCFGKLKNLQKLNLGGSRFKEFPTMILELQGLKYLNISGKGEELPDEFSNLSDLEELILTDYKFYTFPKQLLELKKLRTLALINCDLRSIPASISQIQNLEEIYLKSNDLTDLPDELFDIKTLRYINIESNKFPSELRKIYKTKAEIEYLRNELAKKRTD